MKVEAINVEISGYLKKRGLVKKWNYLNRKIEEFIVLGLITNTELCLFTEMIRKQ